MPERRGTGLPNLDLAAAPPVLTMSRTNARVRWAGWPRKPR